MNKKVEKFLKNLDLLFGQIEEFAKKYNLSWKYENIEIYEEYAGKYETKELYVLKNDDFVFKVKPIGAYIIGAEGRADLIGILDAVVLVYLEKNHFLETKISAGNEKNVISHSKEPLYVGFENPGWYISLERKKIAPINENNICNILENISEFKCPGKNL
ncbi:hypothetical protein [Hippea alviniae]|uniref:hypothetical protein n=1 Tax=Hippea alviniae TaxID=1279027 RepID=UPI0003B41A18|nr:hypothetical protein [Hippea alviniae]